MREIEVQSITLPPVLLRFVDKTSIAFNELCDSIREHGLCNPITVRPLSDFHGYAPWEYEVIDGCHRLSVVRSLGWKHIPATVKHCTPEAAEFLQLQLNATTIETTPLDYARRLRRIVQQHPDESLAWVSRQVSKSTQWVRKMLGLLRLDDRIAKAVERSEIPLQSAYELSKLPQEQQEEWFIPAQIHSAREFCAKIAPTVQQYQERKRYGRWAPKSESSKPYLRNLNEILAELDESKEAAAVLTVEGAKTPLECFAAGLKWATHQDLFTLRKTK